jgi:hypothetical protein
MTKTPPLTGTVVRPPELRPSWTDVTEDRVIPMIATSEPSGEGVGPSKSTIPRADGMAIGEHDEFETRSPVEGVKGVATGSQKKATQIPPGRAGDS